MKTLHKATRRRWTVVGFGVLSLALVATVVMAEVPEEDALPLAEARPPLVTVQTATAQDWQVEITAHGVVEAVHQVVLTSEVPGQVQSLGPDFREGEVVAANQVLARVDPLRAKRDLATAQQALADAKVNYLKQERQAEQAKLDWQRLRKGQKPGSALVLHRPQLDAARSRLHAARAEVAYAKNRVAKTTVRSPFPAIVLKRSVSQGQVLTEGAEVATLQARDNIRVRFTVSDQDWAHLPQKARQSLNSGDVGAVVLRIANPLQAGEAWQSQAVRLLGQREAKTRQRRLVADIAPLSTGQSAERLLPGTFVTVNMQGETLPRVLTIPASGVSATGYIWTVTTEHRLQRHHVEVLAMADGVAHVRAPEIGETFQVVTAPLPSLLPGQKVHPQTNSKTPSSEVAS